MTFNYKIGVFIDFFCDFRLQNSELREDGWTWTKIICKQELLRALARLMNISSRFLVMFAHVGG